MLIEQYTNKRGILIGIWKIEESEEKLLSMLNDSSTILDQIQHISNSAKRCEKLAVRVLLKQLIKEEKKIAYLPTGKPYIENSAYKISISHTIGYATVAIHPIIEIGIDIERINDRVLRIQHRFMNIKEREAIDKRDEPVVSLLHWSAKETAYKLICKEGIDFAKEFIVEPFDLNSKTLYLNEFHTQEKKQFAIDFNITDQYILTVGTENICVLN